MAATQDGFGAGELANISVAADGTVEGFYTNGQSLTDGLMVDLKRNKSPPPCRGEG